MTMYDFFGVEIDSRDAEQYTALVVKPLEDAVRVMHSSTCPNHDIEIDRGASVTLLAEEVRAVSFIMPYWSNFLDPGVVERIIPLELYPTLSKVDSAALKNDQVCVSIPEAEILYSSLISMNQVINMRNALLNMFGYYGDDEDS